MEEINVHKKHRSRMRDKYEKHGPEVFATYELFEMLLYHSIRQGNTNPTAHELLSVHPDGAFGIKTAMELTDVNGVGEKSANLLKTSSDAILRLLCDRLSSEPMKSEFQRRTFMWLWFKTKADKTVAVLLLDSKYIYIDCVTIANGRSYRPEIYRDELLMAMEKRSAKNAVICHNHMNNSKEPSIDDIFLTGYLKKALKERDLTLMTHYIITDTDCIECPG